MSRFRERKGAFWRTAVYTLGFLTVQVQAQRVANTTLNVPQIPERMGYQMVEAFPGLSFDLPMAIVSPPGDTRIFVVEGRGRIQVITNPSNPTKTLFLDITSRVSATGEGGLLGLAFHPDWRNNRRFFVYYTSNSGFHDRLSRFEIDPSNPNAALANSEQILISQPDQENNHNGGDVHFGPDGYLYYSVGDEGSAGDAYDNSRYINKDFFAAIFRIDVDKRPGNLEPNPHSAIPRDTQNRAYYSVPTDNPFIGRTSHDGRTIDSATVRTEIWATGLRNPWRFRFDSATGLLYCADVGQGTREEVNIIARGGDYGWKYREGTYQPSWYTVPNGVTLTDPILDYPRSSGPTIPGGRLEGSCIIGGIVYRGTRLSALQGYYVFGDWGNGRVFACRYDQSTGQVDGVQQLTTTTAPAAFGTDPTNGDLILASYGSSTLRRLVYSSTPAEGEPLPPRLSDTGAFSSLTTLSPHPGILTYDINVPFWSDHALKSRWFSIPNISQTMSFSADGNWTFPAGTVWIKHFDLEITNGVPASRRRLETRFLVKNAQGIHGFTYRWNTAQNDADLVLESGADQVVTIYNQNGSVLRQQAWHYPSRSECLQCHTTSGGFAAGFNTGQLNKLSLMSGTSQNQLTTLSQYGYFNNSVPDHSTLPAMVHGSDSSASIERRVRSYLAANCVQCHQPGGTALGNWDARYSTPLNETGIINGQLVQNFGNPENRVVKPGSLENSILYQRIATMGQSHMPPLATSELDNEAIALLQAWILDGSGTRPSPPRGLRIVNP